MKLDEILIHFISYWCYNSYSIFLSFLKSDILNILVLGEKVEFEAFMQANATLVEGGKWSCFLCGKITSHIGNMRQHFETYHYKTSDSYSCKLCGKQCPTKNALACHKVKCRRKMFIAPSNNKPLF
jgi:hypothetical protein